MEILLKEKQLMAEAKTKEVKKEVKKYWKITALGWTDLKDLETQ